jgi:hypothetical protein
LLWLSETARFSDPACWLKSDCLKRSAPLSLTVALETRLDPSGAPFWSWTLKGATAPAGSTKLSVMVVGAPAARSNLRGPYMLKVSATCGAPAVLIPPDSGAAGRLTAWMSIT